MCFIYGVSVNGIHHTWRDDPSRAADVLRPRMCPGQIVLFMVIFLAFKNRKKVAKQAEKFYIL